MMRDEYTTAVIEAMDAAQVEPEMGLVVGGDEMRAIATYLPTAVLRAIVMNQIISNDSNGMPRSIPMHPDWIAACDDELIDRMLTESLSDEREEQKAQARVEESQRKETPKKGTPYSYR